MTGQRKPNRIKWLHWPRRICAGNRREFRRPKGAVAAAPTTKGCGYPSRWMTRCRVRRCGDGGTRAEGATFGRVATDASRCRPWRRFGGAWPAMPADPDGGSGTTRRGPVATPAPNCVCLAPASRTLTVRRPTGHPKRPHGPALRRVAGVAPNNRRRRGGLSQGFRSGGTSAFIPAATASAAPSTRRMLPLVSLAQSASLQPRLRSSATSAG